MLRCLFSVLFGFLLAGSTELVGAPPADESALPARAARLIATYQKTTNVAEKLRSLRGLEIYAGAAVDDFLVAEYAKLDGSNPRDAQVLGGIFRLWATRPRAEVLPHLIYEGMFHDDAEVVRDCADAIGQMSEEAKVVMSTGGTKRDKDPAEDLATDFIARMEERPDLMPPLERVLALWSGKARPGYKPGGTLKRTPDAKERAAMLEFWKSWYEERFKKKFDPVEVPAKKK